MQDPLENPPLLRDDAQKAQRIIYPEHPRLRRIRTISTLMDQCIVLPTGFRVGLDPLLGLAPGIGDALSALISCYVVYEAACLGLRKRVLLRMLANICLDSLVGSVPVAGDVFDAAWKSNMRNLRLVEMHYSPAGPGRSGASILAWILGMIALLVLMTGAAFYVAAQLLRLLFAAFIPGLLPAR